MSALVSGLTIETTAFGLEHRPERDHGLDRVVGEHDDTVAALDAAGDQACWRARSSARRARVGQALAARTPARPCREAAALAGSRAACRHALAVMAIRIRASVDAAFERRCGSRARLARSSWWCRSCVDSTPTSAMLSAFENWPVAARARHLRQQLRDRARVEDAGVAPARARTSDLVDPVRRLGADERQRVGRAVRLLLARQDRGGHEARARRASARASRRARAACTTAAATRRARRRRGRGTGSGPRPSAPSASGRPATTAGSRRAACGPRGTGPARAGSSARTPRAASASSVAARVAPADARAHVGREQPLERGRACCQRGSWPKPGSRQRVEAAAEELPRHRLLRHRRAREVRDRAARAAAAAARTAGCARPEPPHLGLAEQVVAGEHLVGALAGQHDLDAGVAHQLATAGTAAPARCAGSAARCGGSTSGKTRGDVARATPPPRGARCRGAPPSARW